MFPITARRVKSAKRARVGGRCLQQAEMIPVPLIDRPFERIAMDVIGPLPRTRSGHKYILTICDYATRYPEAIALSSTEAEKVAKEFDTLLQGWHS